MAAKNTDNIILKFIDGMNYNELLDVSGFVSELYYGNEISDVQKRANQSTKKVAALVQYVSSNSGLFSEAKQIIDQRVIEVSASSSEKSASSKKVKKAKQQIEDILKNYDLKNQSEQENALKTLLDIADLFNKKGDYYSAITLLKNVQEIIQQGGMNYPMLEARLFRLLGTAYRNVGNTDQSVQYLNESKVLYHSFDAQSDPGLALTYKELALSFQELGDYVDALNCVQNALEQIRTSSSIDSSELLKTASLKANLLTYMGRYDEAAACLTNVISVAKSNGSDLDDLSLAYTYNNLSVVYQRLQCYDIALSYANKALQIYDRLSIKNHPSIASAYNNIAVIYRESGNYREAEKYLKKALSIYEKTLGVSSADAAATYSNLASVYQAKGQLAEALVYYEKAYTIDTKILGYDHPDVGVLCSNIGNIYLSAGNYTIANDWLETAYRLFSEKLGRTHPYTEEVSRILQKLRDYTAAAPK